MWPLVVNVSIWRFTFFHTVPEADCDQRENFPGSGLPSAILARYSARRSLLKTANRHISTSGVINRRGETTKQILKPVPIRPV
jgi:hypothetical protein